MRLTKKKFKSLPVYIDYLKLALTYCRFQLATAGYRSIDLLGFSTYDLNRCGLLFRTSRRQCGLNRTMINFVLLKGKFDENTVVAAGVVDTFVKYLNISYVYLKWLCVTPVLCW